MKARVFLLRDPSPGVLEIEGEISDEVKGLKKGGRLVFEVVYESAWHELEAIFVIVEQVEIVGLVMGFTNIKVKRDGKYRQRIVIEKVSIKENPKHGLSYDKESEKTKVIVPLQDSPTVLWDIETALTQAWGDREKIPLLSGVEITEKVPITDTSDTKIYHQIDLLINILSQEKGSAAKGAVTLAKAMKEHIRREQGIRQTLVRQNKVHQDAITQLQDKYDKMNEDVKELIENYIPDLSAELTDES